MGGSNSSGAAAIVDDLAFFGASDEAAQYAERPAPRYEVWPENIEIVRLFAAIATQWDILLDMGVVIHKGLDYTRVKAALEMMAVKKKTWPALFDGLRIMELAALTAYREKET